MPGALTATHTFLKNALQCLVGTYVNWSSDVSSSSLPPSQPQVALVVVMIVSFNHLGVVVEIDRREILTTTTEVDDDVRQHPRRSG